MSMKRVEHVERMGEVSNSHKFVVEILKVRYHSEELGVDGQ